MSRSNEKFCLRWNDFESNISGAFRELREDKDFFDVTIACDDEQVQAHKVILSACSPFFRSVLRRNRHEHPLLYLKGVKFTDIVSVLNFMYHGEVNVAQEELNSFLAIAEDLKVKGLTQNETEKKSQNLHSSAVSKSQPPVIATPQINPRQQSPLYQPPPPSKRLHQEVEEVEEIEEIEPPIVKHEPTAPTNHQEEPEPEPYSMQEYSENYTNYEEGVADDGFQYDSGGNILTGSVDENKGDCSELMESVPPDQNYPLGPNGQSRGWRCRECDKRYVSKTQMEDHIRTWHLGTTSSYPCKFCGKQFQSRNSRSGHVSRHHKGEDWRKFN